MHAMSSHTSNKTERQVKTKSPDSDNGQSIQGLKQEASDAVDLKIPVRLLTQEKEVSCYTQKISAEGLQMMSDTPLSNGTPLALQCSFGGVCYLNLAGQVVSCQPAETGATKHSTITIKFSDVRNWEEKILKSALQELAQSAGAQKKSLLEVRVFKDYIALEAAEFYRPTPKSLVDRRLRARQSCIHASKIIGWGAYLPPNEITNQDISAMLNVNGGKTNFGDVVGSLTGIKSRRYAGSRIYPSDLAVEASVVALRNAGIDPKDLEVIISCGVARDVEEPATAYIIQEKLGAHNAYCFDLANACNGFISAIDVLDSFIASGRCETGLVAVGDVLSQYVTWDAKSKRDLHLSSMGYTFGDGGGAAVLQRAQEREDRGVRARWFLSAGTHWRVAVIPLMDREKRLFKSNAMEIERIAAQYIPVGIEEVLEMLHWAINDVDLFIPHQVGIHVVTQILYKKLGIPAEKVAWTFPEYGNVGAASMPIALCEALREGRLKQGDKVLFVGGSGGFGGGIMGVVL
jgi:3-oxoacyl-[acyl-carrier-protein] synthase-3